MSPLDINMEWNICSHGGQTKGNVAWKQSSQKLVTYERFMIFRAYFTSNVRSGVDLGTAVNSGSIFFHTFTLIWRYLMCRGSSISECAVVERLGFLWMKRKLTVLQAVLYQHVNLFSKNLCEKSKTISRVRDRRNCNFNGLIENVP